MTRCGICRIGMFAVVCTFTDHHDNETVLCSSCGSIFERILAGLKGRFDELHARGGSVG